jgi:hypothetical protein
LSCLVNMFFDYSYEIKKIERLRNDCILFLKISNPIFSKYKYLFKSWFFIWHLTVWWPKEKLRKDKQRSTKHTRKTKDRVTRTPLNSLFAKNTVKLSLYLNNEDLTNMFFDYSYEIKKIERLRNDCILFLKISNPIFSKYKYLPLRTSNIW